MQPIACSLNKATKDAAVFRFLQNNAGTCILHIIAGANASHSLSKCSIFLQFSPPYRAFRSSIRFSRTGICYRCAVPTSDRFEHPNRSKSDTSTCKFDDILKPLAFAVYSISSLRTIVIPEAGAPPEQFPTAEMYARWLGEFRSSADPTNNLWEVCHAYIHLLTNSRSVFTLLYLITLD